MGTAESIRERRRSLGLRETEVAERLGISIAAYGDLESYDDEFATALTLGDARKLAAILGAPVVDLLDLKPSGLPCTSIRGAADQLRKQAARAHRDLDDVEEEIGWSLARFLIDPEPEAAEEPIEFLRDVANFLQVDLHSLLDDGTRPGTASNAGA
jgi:transcriptional regulator with XRE-family HTH domain